MQPIIKKSALLLFFLAAFGLRANAQAFVQGTLCNGAFSGSTTCTAVSNVTAGHAYIVTFYERAGTAADVFGISDNNSDSFTIVQTIGGTNYVSSQSVTIAIGYACNISATPNTKPTYSVTDNHGGSAIWGAYIQEIDTIASSCYDQSAQFTASSGSNTVPWNGAAITPMWTKTYIYAMTFTNNTFSPTNQSPFTLRQNFSSSDGSGYYLYTGSSTVTPQFEYASVGSHTGALNVTINLISSSASPAGAGSARHRLLSAKNIPSRSWRPSIPGIAVAGFRGDPVAWFDRRNRRYVA